MQVFVLILTISNISDRFSIIILNLIQILNLARFVGLNNNGVHMKC